MRESHEVVSSSFGAYRVLCFDRQDGEVVEISRVSYGERCLAKVDVEGSNPFSRSRITATYRAIAGWPFSVSGAFSSQAW